MNDWNIQREPKMKDPWLSICAKGPFLPLPHDLFACMLQVKLSLTHVL
jgi:hypothetical protein